MVPLNANLKICKKKAVLEALKRFGIFFLYLVPVNTQNEKYTKMTSEYALLNQISQAMPLVIEIE